jgi:hypothetical protein
MVENPRTHDEIEVLIQLGHPLDGQLLDPEIGQIVAAIKLLGVPDACLADIDAGYSACRPPDRVTCSLESTAPCNQDIQILSEGSSGKQQAVLDSPALRIRPFLDIGREVWDRWRIWVFLVELDDWIGFCPRLRFVFLGVHGCRHLRS